MAKLVYDIKTAGASHISQLDRHCRKRTADGASNIDLERSHLNRILEGDKRGVAQSLQNFYAGGVKRPTSQSETPYLRLVVSASPEYFRPDDPEAVGTWDEDRLEKWLEATMNQLRKEHGEDLIFAELHLDEDTPHIHAVVAPTYLKKARVPGRRKRNETEEQFEDRKEAARAAEGVRTVGRSSHETLSKQGSFQKLRERMTLAVGHLGIEYGQDRLFPAPAGLSKAQWNKQEAARLRAAQADVQALRQEKNKLSLRIKEQSETVLKLNDQTEATSQRSDDARKYISDLHTKIKKLKRQAKKTRVEAKTRVADLDDREKEIAAREAKVATAEKSHAKAERIHRNIALNISAALKNVMAGFHFMVPPQEDHESEADRTKFIALRDAAAASGREPTWGFRTRFRTLNYLTGGPLPYLDDASRADIADAFDKIDEFAEAQQRLQKREKAVEAHESAVEARESAVEAREDAVAVAEETVAFWDAFASVPEPVQQATNHYLTLQQEVKTSLNEETASGIFSRAAARTKKLSRDIAARQQMARGR